MQMHVVAFEKPDEINLIFGMSHFIKTVEDLHEAMATSAPGVKFGVAFCEASGDRLLRRSGNDEAMVRLAVENLQRVGAGHTFLIMMSSAFPIHVMHAVRAVPEVCRIFCATANPLQVIVAETDQGRGVMGVIDGFTLLGIEDETQASKRKDLMRRFGYKL